MSGTEAFWVPALIAGAGTAAEYSAEKSAAGDRRDILNRAFAKTQETTDRATNMVTQEGAKMTGANRMQAMADQEAAAFGQAQQDMTQTGAGGSTIDTAGDGGNVSADFMRAKTDSALTEGNRMTAIARELAKTRAPGSMVQDETLRRADLAGKTGSMFGTARNMSQAATMDAQDVTAPWYGQVGKLAKMAALAYMAGGTGGAGAGGSSAGLAM